MSMTTLLLIPTVAQTGSKKRTKIKGELEFTLGRFSFSKSSDVAAVIYIPILNFYGINTYENNRKILFPMLLMRNCLKLKETAMVEKSIQ